MRRAIAIKDDASVIGTLEKRIREIGEKAGRMKGHQQGLARRFLLYPWGMAAYVCVTGWEIRPILLLFLKNAYIANN